MKTNRLFIKVLFLTLCLSTFCFSCTSRNKTNNNKTMNNNAEIYLAGGCFWGTEHYLKQINGVLKTEVGYAMVIQRTPLIETFALMQRALQKLFVWNITQKCYLFHSFFNCISRALILHRLINRETIEVRNIAQGCIIPIKKTCL